MAIIGIDLNRENPTFTKSDFVFWMPQFTNFFYSTTGGVTTETDIGKTYWNKLYPMINNKIFHSIFGTDWELAMSYAIAHYLTLIAQQQQAPSGTSLGEIAGGGATRGVISSATIGNFSKSYELDRTMLSSDESLFWNQTSYGTSLMTLLKTKAIPSVFVVTSHPLPTNKGNMNL